ncbi:MAG: ACT domain-containing protein [Eubacteriales bacterium]|jgi:ACT domain-containing protein
MKALVTVIGKDQIGIIGGVCTTLAGLDVNILDISQTVMQGYFTMMMIVDLSTSDKDMETILKALREFGESRGLDIRLQRTDIFDAMHTI